jgi:beta-glucosidase
MPWLSQVAGVLEAWYPGQEDGDAIAAVLFGDVNPAGKLPETFPASDRQVPTQTTLEYPGDGTNVYYDEGILVGYRWYDATGQQPLFPFGYGLSYTTFSFSHLQTTPATTDGSRGIAVRFDLTNTGSRAGADVTQVYLGLPSSTGEPPKRLAGFQRVQLNPGETQHVTIPIDPQSLTYWDTSTHAWATADGDYTVYLGDSSRDISLTDTVHVHHAAGNPGSSPSFTVSYTSTAPGQGRVLFGSGPGCSGLVETATQDVGAGSTSHMIVVQGNELPGTVGSNGLQPGATYWYEMVTITSSGTEIDNNGGQCYSVTISTM